MIQDSHPGPTHFFFIMIEIDMHEIVGRYDIFFKKVNKYWVKKSKSTPFFQNPILKPFDEATEAHMNLKNISSWLSSLLIWDCMSVFQLKIIFCFWIWVSFFCEISWKEWKIFSKDTKICSIRSSFSNNSILRFRKFFWWQKDYPSKEFFIVILSTIYWIHKNQHTKQNANFCKNLT